MEPFGVCRLEVADLHHVDEVQDPVSVPSGVMSSPFLHKTIFFSESCSGDLMLYVAKKFDLKRA
jgi:hypothetical protein